MNSRSAVSLFLAGYSIPFTLETAVLLAALTHPNHLVKLAHGAKFLCSLTAIPMILAISLDPSLTA